MAGSRIKGITVEIGGDTTKLQSALKGVNSEIKNTQSRFFLSAIKFPLPSFDSNTLDSTSRHRLLLS